MATVREAPAVPADRVGSAAPMVAVPQQGANEAGLMSWMLVDPVVHDDCIAWTDADTARKGIALDEAARRVDVLYLAECAETGQCRGLAAPAPAPAGGRPVPYRFTDKPGQCRCPDCEQCQHVSNVCACYRAGLHDRTCGPPSVRLVKADK